MKKSRNPNRKNEGASKKGEMDEQSDAKVLSEEGRGRGRNGEWVSE